MPVPGSFGRVRLGKRLQELRERASERAGRKIDRQEAASVIMKPRADVIRFFENGDRLIELLPLTVLARFYECSDDEIAELKDLHELASRPGEFNSFGLPEAVVSYLELERSAVVIRSFQNVIIPGILEVEPYMRRLFQLDKVDTNVIDQRVRARLKRQERLRPTKDAPDPVQLTAVIAEEALLRCAREPDVGPAQLAHLIEVANLDNVEIRVMDLKARMHAGMTGSFTCLTFPKGTIDDFVYQETTSGGQLTDVPSTVAHLVTMFNELRSQALDPTRSSALIAQLAN